MIFQELKHAMKIHEGELKKIGKLTKRFPSVNALDVH